MKTWKIYTEGATYKLYVGFGEFKQGDDLMAVISTKDDNSYFFALDDFHGAVEELNRFNERDGPNGIITLFKKVK